MQSVREKIVQRMINQVEPLDPHKAANALASGVGDPKEDNVFISRHRLSDLLSQAVSLGIRQQVEWRRAERVADTKAFPPPRIVRGLRRAWLVGIGITAVSGWVLGTSFLQHLSAVIAFGLAFGAVLGFCAWTAYCLTVWIWRGFRSDP